MRILVSLSQKRSVRVLIITLAAVYALLLMRMQGTLNHHHNISQHNQHNPRANGQLSFQDLQKAVEAGNLGGPSKVPLDDGAYARPTSSYVVDASDLWEDSSVLPAWMKDYFRWHKEQRGRLNENNWESQRFLLMTCLPWSPKCGGTADRLMSVPLMIKVASQSQRILLIKWGRPAELEEFLLPPINGIDWRVPDWLATHIQKAGERATMQDFLLEMAPWSNLTVLRTRFQSDDHGSDFYNSRLHKTDDNVWEPSFRKVFRDCWNVIFTPAPPVATIVETFLEQNGLLPGIYVASHLRALYAVKERDLRYIEQWTANAVNCTSGLSQGGPIFFASDSKDATSAAMRYGEKQHVLVISRIGEREPVHLDKAQHWQERTPSDYYDTFVDLYLLAMAKCVTFGVGGFGRWASYMSFNSTCSMRHRSVKGVQRCPFVKPPKQQHFGGLEKPIFHIPMPAYPTDDTDVSLVKPEPIEKDLTPNVHNELAAADTSDARGSLPKPELPGQIRDPNEDHLFPNPRGNLSSSLWEDSIILPQWMKDYFTWHREQRKLVNEENWQSFRYIAVICLEGAPKCGGTSDRLRPIPFLLRLAAETNRLLFIKWEKPAPLEAFLVPPVGGMDWRTPDWLAEKFRAAGNQVVSSVKTVVRSTHDKDEVIVRAKLKLHDQGNKYYNEQGQKDGEPIDAFRQHYRDCWYVLFTPAPPIAKIIEDDLEKMHLVPGEYAFAHVRANYGIEDVGRDPALVKSWSRNALNCVSGLRPGGPFFFSSDSAYAKEVAIDYGKERNTTVLARTDTAAPLHLDLVQDWKTRAPAEFYDIFVDLYLMSFGRCMSYNMGGYGKWGLILSGHDFTCNIRHWTKGVGKNTADVNGCNWTAPVTQQQESLGSPVKKLERPLFLPPMG
jgi:hypothetical protein